jgi:TolB protein
MKKLTTLLTGVLMTFAGQAAAQGPAEVIVHDLCEPYYYGAEVWEWEIRCHSYVTTADGLKGGLVGTDVIAAAISPDGGRIAYGAAAGIVVLNLSDWSSTTVSPFGDSPAWSPDGTKLAFAAGELYVMSVDGSGVTQVTSAVGYVGQPSWSPDGLTIAFDCADESGYLDICSIKTDGSSFIRLTSDPGHDSGAAYSPDGLTVAFATSRYGAAQTIAVMNPDGTGVVQLGGGLLGAQPAWSPDGTRIVFGVTYSPEGVACPADGSICWAALEQHYLVMVNADGSAPAQWGSGRNPGWALAVRPVASFYAGCTGETCTFNDFRSWGGNGALSYSWDFGDGTTDVGPTAAHSYAAPGTYTVTLTVEDATGITSNHTKILDVVRNLAPTAAFIYGCSGQQCGFNAMSSSDSDGRIMSYLWSFGDGEASGSTTDPMAFHTYSASGAFAVTLTVTDNAGATGTQQHLLILNTPPVASFTATCSSLTCTANGSDSSDGDGTIVSYAWHFGDGATGSGATVSHTFAGAGTYSVTLTVTDDAGGSSSRSQNVTPVSPAMHVGDLDRAVTTQSNTWTAAVTITVHNGSHAAVPNATVSVSRNDGGTASCTTNPNGQCVVTRSGIPKKTQSVSFTVTNVAQSAHVYTAAPNHDPDGDSNGTSVTVSRP